MKPTRAQLPTKIIAVLDDIAASPRFLARIKAEKAAKWFRSISKNKPSNKTMITNLIASITIALSFCASAGQPQVILTRALSTNNIEFDRPLVTTIFKTNVTEHWPTKWEPEQGLHYHAWNDSGGKWVSRGGMLTQEWGAEVPDKDADSMSIETVITGQRLLSFEFEGRKFSEALTNWTEMHYSVDMKRVRTNVWRPAQTVDVGNFKHYAIIEGAKAVRLDSISWPEFLIETNYFVPVKTNWLGSLEIHGGYWEALTNYFYKPNYTNLNLIEYYSGKRRTN